MTIEQPARYVLERTRDPSIIRECHRRNGSVWHGPLLVEDYVNREAHLLSTGVCSPNRRRNEHGHPVEQTHEEYAYNVGGSGLEGLAFYVLRDTTLPEGKPGLVANVVGACETLTRALWVYDPASDTISNTLLPCFGGVFVPEEHRGASVAKVLIGETLRYLEKELGEQCAFSTLYSEVGNYYAKFGYSACEVPVLLVPVEALAGLAGGAGASTKVFRTNDDTSELHRLHADQIQRQMHGSSVKAVANVPTVDNHHWHIARLVYIADKIGAQIGSPTELPFAVGAYVDGVLVGQATFTHDWGSSTALVLSIAVGEGQGEEVVQALLAGVQRESAALGLTAISMWHSCLTDSGVTVEQFAAWDGVDALAVESGKSNGSILAVRFHHQDTEPFEWVSNAKYCWF